MARTGYVMTCTHCGSDICDPCWKARSADVRVAERAADVRAWALSRISTCQVQENKFGHAWQIGETQGKSTVPQALVEAWTERHTLQAMLCILDGDSSRED